MANLCLLDSFVISDVEFTAFIFGTFMVAFLLRTEWYISLILFLSSMIYYIAAYYALRHELFNIPSLLPLGPITFLAFYFSWTRENMNRKLFQTGYELSESNRRLIEQSRRDALTGLHNRRHMEDFLAHQTALYRRRKTPFSVIFADIDHFKRVNDELGHSVGDKVLKDFAQIMVKESRETDLVVRYGGEEFLIVLPSAGQEEALQLAERIRKTVETSRFASVFWVLTASFGIAGMEEGDDAVSLLRRADDLLYAAKRDGRNLCAVDPVYLSQQT
jgi:diguanylate cyclase (GGDEF)-like protein